MPGTPSAKTRFALLPGRDGFLRRRNGNRRSASTQRAVWPEDIATWAAIARCNAAAPGCSAAQGATRRRVSERGRRPRDGLQPLPRLAPWTVEASSPFDRDGPASARFWLSVPCSTICRHT